MNTHKRHKELMSLVSAAGAQVESITPASSGNTRIIAVAPNGVNKTFFFSTSPGDVRADQNNESLVRRWVRENPGKGAPITAVGQALVTASTKPAPAPAPAPASPSAAEPEKVINKLKSAEWYHLHKWTETASLEGMFSYTDVARAASVALDRTISASSMQTAMETVGVRLPVAPPSAEPKDRVRVVARELMALLRELGKDPSPELVSILGGKRL